MLRYLRPSRPVHLIQSKQVLVLLLRPALSIRLDVLVEPAAALPAEPLWQALRRQLPMLRAVDAHVLSQNFIILLRPHESIRVVLIHLLGQLKVPPVALELRLAHDLADLAEGYLALAGDYCEELLVFLPSEIRLLHSYIDQIIDRPSLFELLNIVDQLIYLVCVCMCFKVHHQGADLESTFCEGKLRWRGDGTILRSEVSDLLDLEHNFQFSILIYFCLKTKIASI